MPQIQAPNITLNDQDDTATQGFEKVGKNVIWVAPSDCPHCLKSFYGRGILGNIINVYTSYGKEQWCAECANKGLQEGTCIQESKLTKEQKKIWEKYLKKSAK